MKSIEERAKELTPSLNAPCLEKGITEILIKMATEQRVIMDAELAEVKRQRDEYYDELLSKRQRIAELEVKLAQTSEKAYEWFSEHMIEYVCYNEMDGWDINCKGMHKDFRKAMEE